MHDLDEYERKARKDLLIQIASLFALGFFILCCVAGCNHKEITDVVHNWGKGDSVVIYDTIVEVDTLIVGRDLTPVSKYYYIDDKDCLHKRRFHEVLVEDDGEDYIYTRTLLRAKKYISPQQLSKKEFKYYCVDCIGQIESLTIDSICESRDK